MMHSDEPTLYEGVDKIRQVQFLLMLCSLLPPDGKLREALGIALALHEEPIISRTTPVNDLHPFATREWMEGIWGHEDLSIDEKGLVEWQNVSENLSTAMRELEDFEQQVGFLLIAQKIS